jgi:hypothetical protein
MPCDTVSTARVKLNADTVDKGLLKAAMAGLGIPEWNWTLSASGTVNVRGQAGGSEFNAEVNRAYAREVVKAKAKQFGWSVKQNTDGTLEVTKAQAMGARF